MSFKLSRSSLTLAVWLLIISTGSLINHYQEDNAPKQTQGSMVDQDTNEKALELAEARRISEIERTVSQLPLDEMLELKGEKQHIAIRYYLQQMLLILALLVVGIGVIVYFLSPYRGRR